MYIFLLIAVPQFFSSRTYSKIREEIFFMKVGESNKAIPRSRGWIHMTAKLRIFAPVPSSCKIKKIFACIKAN